MGRDPLAPDPAHRHVVAAGTALQLSRSLDVVCKPQPSLTAGVQRERAANRWGIED